MSTKEETKMIKKKRRFTALCIFFAASIVTGCSLANSQDSNKKDNTSNTEKTLSQALFGEQNADIIDAITIQAEQTKQYGDYEFTLDSYIYDEKTKTGYVKMEIKNDKFDGKSEIVNTGLLDFGENMELELRLGKEEAHLAAAYSEKHEQTLLLYYQIKDLDGNILIWDEVENICVAEFELENTCNLHKEAESAEESGMQIIISPTTIYIQKRNDTGIVAETDEADGEERAKELKEKEEIQSVEVVYTDGKRDVIVGEGATSRVSIRSDENNIIKKVLGKTVIDVENLESVIIDGTEYRID